MLFPYPMKIIYTLGFGKIKKEKNTSSRVACYWERGIYDNYFPGFTRIVN